MRRKKGGEWVYKRFRIDAHRPDLPRFCGLTTIFRVLHRVRFSQGHTPEHRLVEVPPTITSLHLLRALNPDLTPTQLLNLVAISAESDEPGQPPAEGSDALQQDEGDSMAYEEEAPRGPSIFRMPWSRGPRPGTEATARWPSPSAPPGSEGPYHRDVSEEGSDHTVVNGTDRTPSPGAEPRSNDDER